MRFHGFSLTGWLEEEEDEEEEEEEEKKNEEEDGRTSNTLELRWARRSSKAKVPKRRITNESYQAKVPKRKFPGERSQAKVPKRRFLLSESYHANVSKRSIPSRTKDHKPKMPTKILKILVRVTGVTHANTLRCRAKDMTTWQPLYWLGLENWSRVMRVRGIPGKLCLVMMGVLKGRAKIVCSGDRWCNPGIPNVLVRACIMCCFWHAQMDRNQQNRWPSYTKSVNLCWLGHAKSNT